MRRFAVAAVMVALTGFQADAQVVNTTPSLYTPTYYPSLAAPGNYAPQYSRFGNIRLNSGVVAANTYGSGYYNNGVVPANLYGPELPYTSTYYNNSYYSSDFYNNYYNLGYNNGYYNTGYGNGYYNPGYYNNYNSGYYGGYYGPIGGYGVTYFPRASTYYHSGHSGHSGGYHHGR